VAFIVIYSLLGAVAFYLVSKHARRGPEPALAAVKVEG
jgi:cytochrome d ubiquinol oxidase subunit I